MHPCLSQTLTMSSSFAADVAAFADAGCNAMEVWLTKLEDHLQVQPPEATKQLLQERGIRLAAASFQGGLLLSQGEERRVHYDHFQKRLGLCQEFGIPTLIIVPDLVEQMDGVAWQRAQVSLKQAAQLASAYDVRLALEFRGNSRWCACLATAAGIVEFAEEPNLGLCLDVFHYYTGPSKFEDLGLLTKENLAHVQMCDLAGVPREFASDSDRILPGEGDFQIEPILQHLRQIGYDRYIAVEVLNPDLWKIKPTQVAEAALTGLQRLLGVRS